MRKRLLTSFEIAPQGESGAWLNLERDATVELTSEDKAFPIESAWSIEPRQGWRAADPGAQTIRLVFDRSQELKRIFLVFEENDVARTQEFVLRVSSNAAGPFQEIVRQQWNFSSPSSQREIEEYHLELSHVAALELVVIPDISGGPAHASLKRLRLS